MGFLHPKLPSLKAPPLQPGHTDNEEKSKMPLQATFVVSPTLAVGMFLVNKVWDPVADYMGYPPLDVQRRMDDKQRAVQRVVSTRDDFQLTDPSPGSRLSFVWTREVEQLEKDDSANTKKYHEGDILTTLKCAREATQLTKRADEAAVHFKELGSDASKSRPHPLKGADWEDPYIVSSPYKERLLSFIKDKSDKSNCLGLWGMAGVGKTAAVRNVARICSDYLAGSDTSFRVLSVNVGMDSTHEKVQKTICGLLGLTLAADLTEFGISYAICNRLSGMNYVLILDDLCTPLDLTRLGIPDPSGNRVLSVMPEYPGPSVAQYPVPAEPVIGLRVPDDPDIYRSKVIITCQKVIITTSRLCICAAMGCNQVIHMMPPNQTDAVRIFCDAVGFDVMKEDQFSYLAAMIIKECGCLPEALCKVGRSLSIKKSREEWLLALKMLKQGKFSTVTYRMDNLIERLRRNYEDLDESMKECFLICCLWNEDENIPIEDLIQMWRGRGLIDEPCGHAEGYGIVQNLLQFSLLEGGQNNMRSNQQSHVRVNGMIQKVALQILADRKVKWAANTPWRPALTEGTWLDIQNAWILPEDEKFLSRGSFSEKKMSSHVRMLVTRCKINLNRCLFNSIVFLDMESVDLGVFPFEICKMVTLEYLNMANTRISTLPQELGNLTNLKSLRLRRNPINAIPVDIIPVLDKLHELDLYGTECVLTSILKDELQSSSVRIVGFTLKSEDEVKTLTELCSCSVSAFYICLEYFNSNSINLNMLSSLKKLRELRIINCNAVSLVVQRNDEIEDAWKILSSLQIIEIINVPQLTNISIPMCGRYLKSVSICFALNLEEITWIAHLLNLENLDIFNCVMLRTLVSASMTDLKEIRLPKLSKVYLSNLPELVSLSELPMQLESIVHFTVSRCRRLTRLPVEERNPKVTLDCDEDFCQTVTHDGKASWFVVRSHPLEFRDSTAL